MRDYVELWPGGPFFAQAEHFRLSTDCVLLADFVKAPGNMKAADLGCASGAVGVLLLAKYPDAQYTGIEIVRSAAALAEENMLRNGFDDRSRIVTGDIRQHRLLFKSGSFDAVIANPPYFPVGTGAVSPDEERAAARGEISCTLEDICSAAAFMLRTGGAFFMVHKPERLSEAMVCMSGHGIEPKRLRLVCHRAESAPNLVLVEGRRGGKPGLKIEPSLVLHEKDGSETDEIRIIYHR